MGDDINSHIINFLLLISIVWHLDTCLCYIKIYIWLAPSQDEKFFYTLSHLSAILSFKIFTPTIYPFTFILI